MIFKLISMDTYARAARASIMRHLCSFIAKQKCLLIIGGRVGAGSGWRGVGAVARGRADAGNRREGRVDRARAFLGAPHSGRGTLCSSSESRGALHGQPGPGSTPGCKVAWPPRHWGLTLIGRGLSLGDLFGASWRLGSHLRFSVGAWGTRKYFKIIFESAAWCPCRRETAPEPRGQGGGLSLNS